MPFDVFISYAHEDQELCKELEKHLSNLKRQNVIRSWYDGDISPGSEWKPQILDQLNRAQIILLLVSADFMASDFCYSIEMTRAIARHDADQARVIPIILRPTDWRGAPFAKLKGLPTDGKPVTRWLTHDDAFEDIVQGIRAAVADLPYKDDSLFTGQEDAPMQKYLGKSHAELSVWLSQTWLKKGPPVCFVEGFSGVGKTSLARDLMQNSGWNAVRVEMLDAGSDQVDNLLLDLATELSENGFKEMANAVDSGASLSSALEGVLRKQVLIVIDEFQSALDGSGRTVSTLVGLLEKIANRPQLLGRVLLLSNRLVERGKWSEAFALRTLSALEPEAAELLLDRLLRAANRSQEVLPERRRDIVNWLGCNPRAIRVLVAALERDSLDALIGLSPESWELKDREVSPELLQRLERELLERTLGHLKPETNKLLRQLSVHRKSVKKAAVEMLLPSDVDYTSIRDDLINRFLMEQHSGWFTLNPIVREISLQRLKENPAELRQAHSIAADHYMRHFTAKSIIGNAGQLGGYFVEARYHLVQANREADLSQITARFENHLKASFTFSSPILKERNELNERIAVLSALLEIPGAKGLEYYLARLYEVRGGPGDLQKALTYARRATGPRAPAASWVLRIRLEGQLNGPERALEACRKGIKYVSPEQNLVELYVSCAEILAQASKWDEAISLLQEGMRRVPPEQNLFSLYVSCAEILSQASRRDEAISLLQEGMGRIRPEQSLVSLYVSCAEILSQASRRDEAISLLQEGMGRIRPERGLVSLYVSCAGLLSQVSRQDEAISLLQEGMRRIPPEQGLVSLYVSCAGLLSQANRRDEAISLLQEGIRRIPPEQSFSLYQIYAGLLAQAGRVDEAISLLQEGMRRIPPEQGLVSLYVSCAGLLSQANRRDEAISLLQEGIRRIPANKGRGSLVEAVLFFCTATHNIATIEILLAGTGSSMIDPQQVALGRVLRLQMQREWKLAAEAAHQATLEFSTYFALYSQEAFSWLCADDAKAADETLRRFPRPIMIDKGHPSGWLKALVAVKNGEQQMARECLSSYLGRTLADHEEITLDLLLDLWDTPPKLGERTDLAFYFPTLPPTITRLPHEVTRLKYSPPVLHIKTSIISNKDISELTF